MRLTDFWERMEHRFGAAYADSIARDQVFADLGGRTIYEAIAAGINAKRIWHAVCEAFDVPVRDRY